MLFCVIDFESKLVNMCKSSCSYIFTVLSHETGITLKVTFERVTGEQPEGRLE